MGAKGLSPSIEWDCRHSMQKGGFFKVFMCSKGWLNCWCQVSHSWSPVLFIVCIQQKESKQIPLNSVIQFSRRCTQAPVLDHRKRNMQGSSQRISNWLLYINIFCPDLQSHFFIAITNTGSKKKKLKKNFTEHDKFSFKIRGNVSLCTFVKTGDEYVERKYQWLSYHNSRPGSILIAHFDGTDLTYKKTDNKLSGVMNS